MSIKITIPNSSSDVLTFGSSNTPTAAQIAGIDSGSSNGQLALYTTASGTSTERVRVDSSGNVGVGVTPSAWSSDYKALQIGQSAFMSRTTGSDSYIFSNSYFTGSVFKYINTAAATYYGQDSGIHKWFNAASGTAGNNITFTQAMTLDSSGNLLVGTTTSGGRLTVGTTTGATNFTMTTGSGITNQVNGINFAQNDGGTITSYISAFNSAYGSGVNSALQAVAGGSGGVRLLSGATAWSAISDENLKNVTGTYTTPLADIAQIQAVKFTWKSDETNTPQVGVLAQSVQKVIPEAVVKGALSLEDKTEYLSVRYTEIIPLLIASIQEQQAIITSLTDRITALEGATS